MDRTLGITVSHHQGEMDFRQAYIAGARFAFIRLGSITDQTGECYTDWQFERNARMAAPILPVGFFWFFRPRYSATLQMEYFCNLAEKASYHLPLVLDVEIAGKGMASQVLKALEYIETCTGRAPLIYTRGEFWNTNLGLVYGQGYDFASRFKIWIARYTSDPHPWVTAAGKVLTRVKPKGWLDWTFWQWSADGNGRGHEFGSPRAAKDMAKGSDSICLEWFNGGLADLVEFINGQGYGSGKSPRPEPVQGWKESIDAWARSKGYNGPRP
jgi:lysozyme